jgi:hypothetical protein
MSDLQILLHTEVQLLDWGESRAGGPWIKFRLSDPSQLDQFRGLDTATQKAAGHILHLTVATGDISEIVTATEPAAPEKKQKGPFSENAKRLRLSSFFRTPTVWRAIGTDEEFLEWVRACKSGCVAKRTSEATGECSGEVVAAHVRRVADGAGVGVKPKYAAVPLCARHHALQHAQGESAVAPKEQWDKWRIETVAEWAWQTLKASFGYDSWANVPPERLALWCKEHLLEREYDRTMAEAR